MNSPQWRQYQAQVLYPQAFFNSNHFCRMPLTGTLVNNKHVKSVLFFPPEVFDLEQQLVFFFFVIHFNSKNIQLPVVCLPNVEFEFVFRGDICNRPGMRSLELYLFLYLYSVLDLNFRSSIDCMFVFLEKWHDEATQEITKGNILHPCCIFSASAIRWVQGRTLQYFCLELLVM